MATVSHLTQLTSNCCYVKNFGGSPPELGATLSTVHVSPDATLLQCPAQLETSCEHAATLYRNCAEPLPSACIAQDACEPAEQPMVTPHLSLLAHSLQLCLQLLLPCLCSAQLSLGLLCSLGLLLPGRTQLLVSRDGCPQQLCQDFREVVGLPSQGIVSQGR